MLLTDECDKDPCMNGATCVDGAGTFTCVCPFGYKGTYCQERDADDTCSLDACTFGRGCIDNYVINSRYCVCSLGWYYGKVFELKIHNKIAQEMSIYFHIFIDIFVVA